MACRTLCLIWAMCLSACGGGLIEAERHYAEGRYASALAAYRDVYDAHRHDAGVNHRIGQTYLRLERFERAEKFFRRAVVADPRDTLSWWHLGLCRARRTMYADALEAWTTYVELVPADPGGFNNIGLMHLELGALDRAEAMFDKAIELGPDFGRPLLNKGLLYERHRDDAEQAAIWYRRYRQVDPAGADSAGVRDWLLAERPDRAGTSVSRADVVPAGSEAESSPAAGPVSTDALSAPEAVAIGRTEMTPPAVAVARSAGGSKPVRPHRDIPAGAPDVDGVEALMRAGRYRVIIDWAAREPGHFEPDGRLSLLLGRAHFELEAFSSAITHLERARRLLPDDPRPVIEVGRVHHVLGDYNRARTVWKAGARQWPGEVEFPKALGLVQ